MKFKIFRYQFLIDLIVIIVSVPFFIYMYYYMNHVQPEADGLGFIALLTFFLVGYSFRFRRRKDHYSSITITESGIDVTCFGFSWFNATWDEIIEIGEFDALVGGGVMNCIYFSKEVVAIDENIFSGIDGTPRSAKTDYQVVFLDAKPKMRAEIFKHIDERRIIVSEHDYQHGLFKVKKIEKIKDNFK